MAEIPSPETLIQTRQAWHRVAEHVLSAALKRATGQFALRPGPGGFRTPPFGDDERVLAVVGADIVVSTPQGDRQEPLTTLRAAATLVGTEPGYPSSTGSAATPFEPDAPLIVDNPAAQVLADWFALGADALARFADEFAGDAPSAAQLYPEHFDVGIAAGAINYGASPGDDSVSIPYLYVGPHGGPPPGDDFWNAPFGAYRTIHEIRTAEQGLAFFSAGRDRVLAAKAETRSTS